MQKHPILYLILVFIFSCTTEQYQYSNIDYESLKKPSTFKALPDELEEISGLEYFSDNQLIAINDEIGTVYILNATTFEIEQQINFEKNADFEGIATNGDFIYVITSEGELFEINYRKHIKPIIYQIDIEGKEIESLCFHEGKLYTMTKEINDAQEMIVYSLDPSSLNSPPKKEFSITLETIKNFLAEDEDESILKEFTKFISGNNIYNFVRPSGIAFHPKTDHMFMLSHHNRFLMEVDKKGQLYNIYYLSSEKFYQPEGITFDPDGALYISNEARGHKPNILKFNSI